MDGIRCARCGNQNAEGSRFCGVCGVRLGTVPPTEPPARPSESGPVVSDDVRAADDAGAGDDLDASVRVPVSRGARVLGIVLLLLLDGALAAAGVALWRAGKESAASDGAGSPATVDAAAVPDARLAVVDAAAGPIVAAAPAATPAPPAPSGGRSSSHGPAAPAPVAPAASGGADGERSPLDEQIAALRDAGARARTPDAAPPEQPDAPVDARGPVDPYTSPDPGTPDAGARDGLTLAEEVSSRIARSQRQVARCYRDAADSYTPDQPLEGQVDIAFRVMPTGEVRDVAAVRNTTGSEPLAECLSGVVAGWRFTAQDGAESTEFVRPFTFTAPRQETR